MNNTLVLSRFFRGTFGMIFVLSISLSIKAEILEKTIGLVNTEVILESDITLFLTKNSHPEMIDDVLLTNGTVDDLKTNRKAILDYLINLKIIEYEVRRLNLTATEDRVDMSLRDLAKSNNTNVGEIETYYKTQGFSKTDLRNFIKSKVERQALIDTEIMSKLKISDEDILNEYQKKFPNRKQLVGEITVSHIFFNPKKSGGIKAATTRAHAVLEKLRKGEKFETLAEQFSEDTNFSNGGLLGSFKSGEASREIEGAIQNLKPDQFSEVVLTKRGAHIFKLLDRKSIQDPQFDKDKDEIAVQLKKESFRKSMKKWLKTKREEAFIRIND